MAPNGGSIVFFSSVMAQKPDAGLCAYAASKGAVESLTRAMVRELAPQGIRVNAVAPGLADTDMARGAGEKVLAERLARIPMGRMTDPAEIARVCAFLLSDAAPTLTGQVLGVDGGMAP
jgi:3-oxoacyl-[acyl-carrier protein] reductase